MHRPIQAVPALMLLAVLWTGTALASEPSSRQPDPRALSAQEPAASDPYATVYVVTSRSTYASASALLERASSRSDSLGTPLVIAQTRAHQLAALAEHVHHNERRCGGFFAFATRAEAEAFVRADRSAQAIRRTLLADYTIDNQATVDPWLPQVDEQNIHATIDHLQGYTNRYYASATGKSSAEWIRATWQALGNGRSDVSTELISCGSCATQPSVILTVQGAELPDEVVVLGAHLDSINAGGGGNTQIAPGADDDASGIATLTEVIRIALANGWKPRRTVKFMGYAAEEVGLRGSNAIATSFRDAGVNVVGVLQLDMTNYKVGAVEDMQLISDYSNAELKTFFTQLFDEYLAPLGLTRGSYTCGYGCSDHASWTSAGYPAAMMFEAGSSSGYNPYIHSEDDTLQNMGDTAQHSVKFAQFGLAFLGELAKTEGGGNPPTNAPPVANFSSSVNGLTVQFTDTSTDSDGTIASRSWNFGDGSSSTQANPSKTYAAAGTYTVTLTVTDDDGATNTKTSSVTVGGGGGGGVLQNGVPKTGLSGASGSAQYFTLQVPAGATNLKFVTAGGTGDADLYVRFGSQPTTSTYDCRPYLNGNNETCTISSAQAGTYHVMIRGYSAYSGLSLTGSYSTGGGGTQTYTNGTDVAIGDNATVQSTIAVSGRSGNAPSNAQVQVTIVHTYIGDLKVDLLAPDGSVYVLHNRSGGSADNINKTYTVNLSSEPLNGSWRLRVNDNASSDTGRIDSWSITF
jgi:leucyl aminopeptidase